MYIERVNYMIGEVNTLKFLKWKDDVVAKINSDFSVDFIDEKSSLLANPDSRSVHWSSERFAKFLDDRIISRQRRDIEKILFRLGLSNYDTFKIAERTKAINAKDLLWVTDNENDLFSDTITDVFENIFIKKVDSVGDSINSPDGCNIKRYGVYGGNYGIYKNRLHPLSTDVESEVAVYKLAQKIGVECCEAVQTDENTVFSKFEYNFSKEQIVHFRHLFDDGERTSDNELENLISKRPEYTSDFYKMVLLDFITKQDDRHLSNFSIKINPETRIESFYPLYDNGRSLFYQDNEKTIANDWKSPSTFCTTFGVVGTYYDHITDILTKNPKALSLVDLSLSEDEIYSIMKASGFEGAKLEGIVKWISNSIQCLFELQQRITQTNDFRGRSKQNKT